MSLFGYIRVKHHFPIESPSWYFLRSSFNKFAYSDKSHTVENNEVSSANNLADDSKFCGRSLMYIKKSSGPNIDPWGNPARTEAHLVCWRLRPTFCCLSRRKLWLNFLTYQEFLVYIKRPSCQTLSTTLKMSGKIPLTSSVGLWSKSE